ncbi:MAG: cysteine desulfurase [Hyphomicrobiales bacterium]|nr:cysteine desulfurase [Hyphomicrobiales bacterium]
MTVRRAYLDHNATAPLRAEAREAMIRALDVIGNPSSVHAEGRAARALIETARERVAALVNARPADVVFTSGATEANNAVLAAGWDVVALCGIEHDSVRAPAARHAGKVRMIAATADGQIDLADAEAAVASQTSGRRLLAIQLVNNETGVIQPVRQIAAAAKAAGWNVLCDAVQAPGRIAIDITDLGADYLVISAHKLGGPKGAGALIVSPDAPKPSALVGGGQERSRRAGTENIAAIAGFAAAADAAARDLGRIDHVAALRDRLEAGVRDISADSVVIGAAAPRVANTSCIALPRVPAEVAVVRLDLMGIAASAGAACSSGKVGASATLAAMGLPEHIRRSAVRVSIGPATIASDIDQFLTAWREIAGSSRLAA